MAIIATETAPMPDASRSIEYVPAKRSHATKAL
jgi:hypothetical protein